MLGCHPNDQLAMPQRHRMRRDNEAAVGLGCERRDSALDIGSIVHSKREDLYTECRPSGFGRT